MYNLQRPICSSLFNFKKFVSDSNTFWDSYHGHIVTSDPRIIKDNKIREHLIKVLKYHKPRKIDFDQARENINNGMEDCKTWNTRCCFFLEWKTKLMELVNNRIAIPKVKNTSNCPTGTSSLKHLFKKRSSTCV